MPGVFITFEGPDGAGKTTQVQRLQQFLEACGHKVLITREPGGTVLSEKVRGILLDPENLDMEARTEALLYAAARAQHVEQKLKPALEAGMVILCDRFSDSTVAYQGYGRGIDLDFLSQVNRLAENGLTPDLTLIFDIESEIGFERIQSSRNAKDRLEMMDLDFHKRVRQGFLQIAAQNPARCCIIDASEPIDVVTSLVQHFVEELLKSKVD